MVNIGDRVRIKGEDGYPFYAGLTGIVIEHRENDPAFGAEDTAITPDTKKMAASYGVNKDYFYWFSGDLEVID